MAGSRRSMPSGAALLLTSLAFLVGMHVDALARVMWVEDRVGEENFAIVAIVNSNPPSLIIMTILALIGLGLGTVMWFRDRRNSASG